ncbi:MAG: DNA polymerase III subunit alpha, partial [Clostridia bacterium]|nr:DNA polymerase III subunit alpha [Clostridia bacterium]
VDPLKYDLIFERFLNPDRVSMPDFDVDFCTKRRYETIEYVRQKYGEDKVAQIVTFGTLASRAVIKDIGRVMRVPYSETDKVTKLMDGKSTIAELLGRKIPALEKKLAAPDLPEEKRGELEKALAEQKGKKNREFIEVYETNPDLKKVIDFGLKLEGMPKNTSEHAAGVIICRKVLAENVPLARNGDDVVTQFDMKEAEAVGMLKMDFLALTTLTDIQNTLDYIKEDYGIDIDFHKLGYDVPEAYQLISSGDTDAVFQLEQGGMKKFMRDLQPEKLEDLIAGISLYRPGPMDFIPTYIKNRHNPAGIVYDTPLLEPILKNSYGVIIYQEQVMQIFQKLAGYTFGQADLVRRAMAKKKKKELMAQKDKFIYGDINEGGNITGCVAHGIPPEVATKIFADMESFASYAFNKSHATAYAVVAYQTAYLKYFYPKQFLAGILNDRLDKIEEISKYVVYMKEKKIPVYPPDINKSRAEFRVEKDGIRFGLCALRGAGEEAVKKIIEERNEHGLYKSFQDFLMRCTKYINKRVAECLILGGAFDCFGYARSQYYAVYDDAMTRIAGTEKQKGGAQISLFGTIVEEPEIEIRYPNIPEFDYNDKLSKEKQMLGVYVSGHPFEQYLSAFKNCSFNCSLLADKEEDEEGNVTYNNLKSGQSVTMGGIVSAIKKLNTKQNTTMAFITVEDLYGSVECIAFPNTYEKIRSFLAVDVVVALSGKMDIGDKRPTILLDGMQEFSAEQLKKDGGQETANASVSGKTQTARAAVTGKPTVLWLNASALDDGEFDELQEMLSAYTGDTEVRVVRGGQKFRYPEGITRSKAFEAELRTFLPADCIKYV